MTAMLHEMAAAIAEAVRDVTQHDGEDDAHFILDTFYIAPDPTEGTA